MRFSTRSLAAVASLLTSAACTSTSSSSGTAVNATPFPGAYTINYQGSFRAPMGIQLWSFREAAKKGVPEMLSMTRRMGITHVETAGLYGMTATQFAEALRNAGLQATSMHVGYDELTKTPDKVIADAKALGARYVGLAWYPHTGTFTEADARKAIADFNKIGQRMKDAGLHFFYHTHGFEPERYNNETLLDLMIRETDPSLVSYEMDVLWTFLPGGDPAGLIRKYPGRFKLMHIKDMKPGVARGNMTGGIPDEQKAVIGQGQVNWAEVMEAAAKDGMEYYYLEDESTDPVGNVPKSIAYLEHLRY